MFFVPPADPGYTGCCHVFVVPLLPPVFFVVLGRRVRMCSLRHVFFIKNVSGMMIDEVKALPVEELRKPNQPKQVVSGRFGRKLVVFFDRKHIGSTLFLLQLFPSQWESL